MNVQCCQIHACFFLVHRSEMMESHPMMDIFCFALPLLRENINTVFHKHTHKTRSSSSLQSSFLQTCILTKELTTPISLIRPSRCTSKYVFVEDALISPAGLLCAPPPFVDAWKVDARDIARRYSVSKIYFAWMRGIVLA